MKIKWHKVTWYSKALSIALFIILPFVGLWLGIQYGKMAGQANSEFLSSAGLSAAQVQPSPDTLIPYYTTPSQWQTDANNTNGGFSIAYPIDFDTQDNYSATPSTDWRLGANGTNGVKYFTLTVPRAFEPQTNFIDTTLTVGASGSKTAVAQCLTAGQSGGPLQNSTSTATINGIQFTVFKSSDAGAGNYYNTRSYRTVHAGKCYAIEYTVHSSQIMNYPQSYDLKPFDEIKIDALMRNIINTFTFK